MAIKKKLKTSDNDRWIAGVCGGLGKYFDTDPLIFRIAFILLTLFSGGAWILVYLILWLFMPSN